MYQVIESTMPKATSDQWRAICEKRPEVVKYIETPANNGMADDVRVKVYQKKVVKTDKL